MKQVVTLLLVFCFLLSKSQQVSLADARKALDEVVVREKSGQLFLLNVAKDKTTMQPIIMGYAGAIKAILAKHYFNPWAKLNTFNEGKELLETAIQKDTQNIELIFLRFMIQTNAPQFLGYNQYIAKDKQRLISALPGLKDKTLQSKIVQYLRENGELTTSERAKLEENL